MQVSWLSSKNTRADSFYNVRVDLNLLVLKRELTRQQCDLHSFRHSNSSLLLFLGRRRNKQSACCFRLIWLILSLDAALSFFVEVLNHFFHFYGLGEPWPEFFVWFLFTYILWLSFNGGSCWGLSISWTLFYDIFLFYSMLLFCLWNPVFCLKSGEL